MRTARSPAVRVGQPLLAQRGSSLLHNNSISSSSSLRSLQLALLQAAEKAAKAAKKAANQAKRGGQKAVPAAPARPTGAMACLVDMDVSLWVVSSF